MARLGGVAALIGGLAWTVKGTVILIRGDQPPLLFEVAPMLFGVALLSVAYSTLRPSRRRAAALGLAAVSAIAGVVALASELVGEVVGMALAISSIALLIGLLLLPRRGQRPAPLAWWIGATTLPALLVGGLLSELDERLLEVPLTCLGVAWTVLGWTALSTRSTRGRRKSRVRAHPPTPACPARGGATRGRPLS
ncbi:hypothetical protein ACFV9G_00210 [Nocardioides sp. NPDC059952]|uniref:hypothetical protein n=1 Tax=Nocardioides sp. NPDC059952 TaxID=3347014 RepID=UPI0036549C2C